MIKELYNCNNLPRSYSFFFLFLKTPSRGEDSSLYTITIIIYLSFCTTLLYIINFTGNFTGKTSISFCTNKGTTQIF